MRYPLANVTYDQAEIDAVVATLKAGRTTCGPRVAEFENLFAQYVQRKHAVMVNSGSSADLLLAFGLGQAKEGEEILVPAVTWPTQVSSCLNAGYRVRLVDVDPTTLQMDPNDLMRKLSPATRAVFLVHVLGNVGDMDLIQIIVGAADGQPKILEDCCEALGSEWNHTPVGTFGLGAAFSFFFSHMITTMEGGMVVTDSANDEHQYRLLRSHGWEPKRDYRFWFPTWGFNVRPTELQGAFGVVQMGKLEGFRRARVNNALRLDFWTQHSFPEYFDQIRVLPRCSPAWHGYPVMLSTKAPFTRNMICDYLNVVGVETRPIIAGNLARQPALRGDDRVICGELPGSDAVHERGFYIGLASFEDDSGTEFVGRQFEAFMKTLTK